MTIIYICGPMTDIPDWNFPAFNSAAEDLRADGWEVINPADIPGDQTDWTQCMKNDIKHLLDCGAVYMLMGWENSKGASLEHHIASELGLELYYEEDDYKNDKRTDTERTD